MKYKITSNHEYKLAIEKDTHTKYYGYLISNIYFNGGWIDKIICGPAYANEQHLNSGRFINYINKKQEFDVQKYFKADLFVVINKTSLFLDAISKHIHNKWNVVIWVENFSEDGSIIYDFSFEKKEDALLFSLSI